MKNYAFDIAFEVQSENDPEKVTAQELWIGLMNRLADVMQENSIVEACGMPYDEYDMDENPEIEVQKMKDMIEKKFGRD